MTAEACFRLAGVEVLRRGRSVLSVPDLRLCEGETTAVVGPSGAGKSTLLRLLAGLETPTAGEVISRRSLVPGRVVMVFQRPVLLRGTVLDNAALGLRLRGARRPEREAAPWLERLGLGPRARQSVRTLSGGEYQRVALARALALRPAALLLDEPTSNLDPANVGLIERLVAEAQAEMAMTVVWVTHNPVQARRVARSVVLLIDGAVVEHSPVEGFFGPSASPHTREFLGGGLVW